MQRRPIEQYMINLPLEAVNEVVRSVTGQQPVELHLGRWQIVANDGSTYTWRDAGGTVEMDLNIEVAGCDPESEVALESLGPLIKALERRAEVDLGKEVRYVAGLTCYWFGALTERTPIVMSDGDEFSRCVYFSTLYSQSNGAIARDFDRSEARMPPSRPSLRSRNGPHL